MPMDDMTKEEIEEFQERLSKLHAGAPETLAYPTRLRLKLLANLIIDRVEEDQKNGAPLLRKIQRETKSAESSRKGKL